MRAVGIVLAAVALISGCSRKAGPGGTVRVDPSLAMLVPPDAVALQGVRVEEIRKTPIYRKLLSARPAAWIDEFARRTGIDPRKDLWELLVVSDGKQVAVLARGKFTPQGGLEPKIDIPNATRTPYKGYTVIGTEQAAVAFLNATTAVTGRPDAVRYIIDQRGRSNGIPRALADLMKTFPAASQIWGVTMGGPSFLADQPLPGNWANVPRLFASIQTTAGGADLRNGVDLAATVTCVTDKDAKQAHDAAKAFIAIGRLQTPDNESDLLRFFDAFQVTQEGRQVKIAVQEPEDLLEKFVDRVLK